MESNRDSTSLATQIQSLAGFGMGHGAADEGARRLTKFIALLLRIDSEIRAPSPPPNEKERQPNALVVSLKPVSKTYDTENHSVKVQGNKFTVSQGERLRHRAHDHKKRDAARRYRSARR
jgi:hypothetical protein